MRDLAESDEVNRLLLLDLDEARARATGEAHAPDAEVARVDPAGGLGYLLAGVDVLVNSASYRVNLDAMRACLEAGCHYIDLGGLYHLTTRQLELDHDFSAAGKLALLGMGSSPGQDQRDGACARSRSSAPRRSRWTCTPQGATSTRPTGPATRTRRARWSTS